MQKRRIKIDALSSWRSLNKVISSLGEKELAQLLKTERHGKRRANVLRRLHQRATRLRMHREREQL